MQWNKSGCRIYWRYSSQAVRIGTQYVGFARVSHHNGPRSAYAEVWIYVTWPTYISSHWGHYLSRHFQGNNATQRAMRWAEFLLSEDGIPWNVREERAPSADFYREFGIKVGDWHGHPTIQRTRKQLPRRDARNQEYLQGAK